MIWRRIQSIKAIPFGFDIRTFGERETHAPEDLNSALMHLMKRVQRTNLVWCSRKRDVDARERFGFFFSTNFFRALIQRRVHRVARLIERLTDHRAFVLAKRFHPLAPFGDAPAFAEIFYTDAFKGFLVARSEEH